VLATFFASTLLAVFIGFCSLAWQKS